MSPWVVTVPNNEYSLPVWSTWEEMCVCSTPTTLNAKPQFFFLSRDDKSKYTAIPTLDPNVSPVTISLVDTERGGVRGCPSILVMKGWKRPYSTGNIGCEQNLETARRLWMWQWAGMPMLALLVNVLVPRVSVGWPKRALLLMSKAYTLRTLRLLRDLHTAASESNIH